ncbi:hypothetical protein HX049_18210, partial [Myroides odoratimimus]|uniref:hypothetical protein n=1 Tax=Myroides odoratimimus TaxID=76832 RepID=UPI002575F225
NNPVAVKEIIEKVSKEAAGNVIYDGTDLIYKDAEGKDQVIDLGAVVKANETVTQLVDNKDGTFTYYNEEAFDENGTPIPAKGVTFTLPTYDSYIMTQMEEFEVNKVTERKYNYNQIVHTYESTDRYKPNPAINFAVPVYEIDFNVNVNDGSQKFIQFSTIFMAKVEYINNIVAANATSSGYRLELVVNGKVINSQFFNLEYVKGGQSRVTQFVSKAFKLKDVQLQPTNNKFSVQIIPQSNLFYANRGTGNGQFREGNSLLLTLSLQDISFQLFEK